MARPLLVDGWPETALAAALNQPADLPVERRLLPLWFGPPDGASAADADLPRRWWFVESEQVDAALIALFSADVGRALRGDLNALAERPEGALTLALLLNTLPQRLWRGSDRAQRGAPEALAVTLRLIRDGGDAALPPLQRAVAYSPLLSSTDPIDLERACALYDRLDAPYWQHQALIKLQALTG